MKLKPIPYQSWEEGYGDGFAYRSQITGEESDFLLAEPTNPYKL